MNKIFKNFMFKVGAKVVNDSKAIAPFKTGNLKKDIQVFKLNIDNKIDKKDKNYFSNNSMGIEYATSFANFDIKTKLNATYEKDIKNSTITPNIEIIIRNVETHIFV